MQVTELSAQGLKREYRIVVPADEIEGRVRGRLERLQRTARVPGFRPGKAPLPLLKKQYGRSLMGEVLEEAIDEGAKRAVADNGLRPALRPKVEVTSFDEGKDLEFQVNLETLPEVPEVDLGAIELARPVAQVEDARVDEAVAQLAKARQRYKPVAEPRPARDGDQLVIDFEGRIGGEPFPGGAAKDFPLALGAGSMIPGFEEGLAGASAGESRQVAVTFPADYGAAEVAGKEAVFDVQVKEVREPEPMAVDDEWAKGLGLEGGLEELRTTMRERFEGEYRGVARQRMKRALLDHLAGAYRFDVPQGMVDLEFEAIWKQLAQEMERTGQTFDAEGERSEEALRAEYRTIAERRVRLGLLLSDVGNKNAVRVEGEELQRAVVREAQRFPGREREIFEFFRSNAGALEQLRAPLFEDKVCDLIFSKARVTDQPVAVEELMREPDEDEEDLASASPSAVEAASAADEPASAEPAEPAADGERQAAQPPATGAA